jgi:hypothetical protein
MAADPHAGFILGPSQGPSILAVRQRPILFGNAYAAVFWAAHQASISHRRTIRGVQCGLPGTETASHFSATVKYTGSQCNCDDSSKRHPFSPNYPLAGISMGHYPSRHVLAKSACLDKTATEE